MNLRFLTGNSFDSHAETLTLGPLSLDRVSPGRKVVLQDLSRLTPDQQAHLRAYGIAPGRELRVLQQQPETVIQVEFTELALEKEIARKIVVVA